MMHTKLTSFRALIELILARSEPVVFDHTCVAHPGSLTSDHVTRADSQSMAENAIVSSGLIITLMLIAGIDMKVKCWPAVLKLCRDDARGKGIFLVLYTSILEESYNKTKTNTTVRLYCSLPIRKNSEWGVLNWGQNLDRVCCYRTVINNCNLCAISYHVKKVTPGH